MKPAWLPEGASDPQYGWWFRLWHNGPGLQRRKGPKLFSERYAGQWDIPRPLIARWRIFVLKPVRRG